MGSNIDFVSALLQSLQKSKRRQGEFGLLDDDPTEVPAIAPPVIPDREAWRTQIMPPPVAPTAPVAAPVTAPPVITPTLPATITPPVEEAADTSPAEAQLQEELGRDYSIKKDEAGNIIHRGKDRDKKWSIWDKVGSAAVGLLAGGVPGAIKAGTDRNFFEKMGSENKIARLAPQVQMEQQIAQRKAQTVATQAKPAIARLELRRKVNADKSRFDNQTRAMDIQGQRLTDAKERYKVQVDENGLRWKEFINDPSRQKEPILDPITREQDVDPTFKTYDYVDPQTGRTVQLKGNQLATVGATIAAGNAQRTQAAATTNANNEMEAQRANVANAYNYSKALFDRTTELAKAGGETAGNVSAMQGLYQQLETAGKQLESVDPIVDEKGYAAALKQFNDLQEKFYQAAAKTTSGAQVLQQMKVAGIARPGVITAPKIKPTLVGKPVPKSRDPLGLFQ